MLRHDFKIGDLVQLIGGGPQMVVIGHTSPPATRQQIYVAWHEPSGRLRREWLPPQALERVVSNCPA